jgi:hypothetical protein
MKKASAAQTEKLLRNKVNKITDLSETLAGKKPVGGRIGRKLAKQKDIENDVKLGKKIRDKKFKDFDAYCARAEAIANNHQDETKTTKRKIKIKRATIVNPKNPSKVI